MKTKKPAKFSTGDVANIIGIKREKMYSWAVGGWVPVTESIPSGIQVKYMFDIDDLVRVQVFRLLTEAKIHLATASEVCKDKFKHPSIYIGINEVKIAKDVSEMIRNWERRE